MAILELWGRGEGRSRRVGITHRVTTIGRGLANAVVLRDDLRASLRHASVLRTVDGYVIRDEGSANGTWVNGERVLERVLHDGDQLQLGDTVVLFNPAE